MGSRRVRTILPTTSTDAQVERRFAPVTEREASADAMAAAGFSKVICRYPGDAYTLG